MNISEKIRLLRAEMGWSQKELAEKIDADQAQISGYERGEALPSIGVIKRLANVFNVTTDYLLFDENDEKASAILKDKELLKLFEKIEALDDKDKKTLKDIIEITIVKNTMQSAAQTKII
jgi:transcriptional regulator with XRE-family HTH domain